MADLAKVKKDGTDDMSDLAVQPEAARKEGLNLNRPDVDLGFGDTSATPESQAESGRIVGRGIVQQQGNQFLAGVAGGAAEAMGDVQAATQDVIGEVQRQSGEYFRNLAKQFQ